jgi:prolyl oligopeptidase
MKKILIILITIYGNSLLYSQFHYPYSQTIDSIDYYFGKIFKDPYRWLEKIQDDEVKKWFNDQAELTNSISNKISGKKELVEEWQSLEKYKSTYYFNINTSSDYIIYQKKEPSISNTNLYIKKKSSNTEEILIDTKMAIDTSLGFTFESTIMSYDGKKAVLSFLKNGTEVSLLKILNIETKTILKDSIYPSFGNSVRWSHDNNSFIYVLLPTDDNTSSDFLSGTKTKLHHVGDNLLKDKVYCSITDYPELKITSDRRPGGEITYYSPNYIFAYANNDDGIILSYYAPKVELNKAHISWKSLSKKANELIGIDYKNDKVFAISKKNAKNYKLIATTLANPNWEKAEIISNEKSDLILEDFKFCKDYILITYSNGINNRVFKYNFKTKKNNEVKLPLNGTASIECIDKNSNEVYLTIASWIMPPTEYKLNVNTDEFIISDFNKAAEYPKEYLNIVVEEIEIKGHDGAMIPLTILYKADLKKDGTAICYMDSYGGYGYSMKPTFSYKRNSLIKKDVVVAIPHVRGGGEKGEEWYKGGFKNTKPNSWKDFNSCAEYLIQIKYTSAKKIIAHSGSLGGILVAGAINEKPNLYGAAISGSGVLNSLRMEKMPNGSYLTGELGTIKDSAECIALEKMDGLFQISKTSKYPSVICYIGMNDPRVSPWQSAKFIAALQNLANQSKPFLLNVDFNGGHGPSSKMYAEQLSIAQWQCGHPDFQLK